MQEQAAKHPATRDEEIGCLTAFSRTIQDHLAAALEELCIGTSQTKVKAKVDDSPDSG